MALSLGNERAQAGGEGAVVQVAQLRAPKQRQQVTFAEAARVLATILAHQPLVLPDSVQVAKRQPLLAPPLDVVLLQLQLRGDLLLLACRIGAA
jgi:hypothetical protein